uniref:Uncharacterized protein n=1 Tax=Guillardia theta TaxID=55529 RepID=A0A7S4UBJ2_GUITH|mmetsp:Transcript_49731/g.155625  ORF Transcript_49731/g.155625 Transcript_49731/m.155625 type:complete len:103 (+) Transcript_49731:395-703(+)
MNQRTLFRGVYYTVIVCRTSHDYVTEITWGFLDDILPWNTDARLSLSGARSFSAMGRRGKTFSNKRSMGDWLKKDPRLEAWNDVRDNIDDVHDAVQEWRKLD